MFIGIRSDSKDFALLYWVLLSHSLAISAMLSVLPAVGRESGIPDPLLVSIQALSAALAFVMAPLWAARSDRAGRKPIILMGCAGFTLSCLVTGFSMLVGIRHWVPPLAALACLIVGRAIYGTFGIAAMPAAQAYVAERTSREMRTQRLAGLASAQGFGGVLGPAIAPLLILPPLSLAGPLVVIGVLSVATFIAIRIGLGQAVSPDGSSPVETRSTRRTLVSPVWRDPRFQRYAIAAAMFSICAVGNLQMVGFLIIDVLDMRPIAAQPYAAITLMSGAVLALVGQLGFIPWFRMRPAQLILWGALLAAAGNVLMAFAAHYAVVLCGFALSSLGYAFARPGYTAAASLVANREEQGEVAGILMSAGMTGLIFAPVAAMSLYQLWRPGPFLVGVVMMLVLTTATLRTRENAPYPASERPQ